MITIYANMSHLDQFKKNVVNDGRSYSDETFEKTVQIINNISRNIAIPPEINEKFQDNLVGELKDLKKLALEEAEKSEDAPKEILGNLEPESQVE